MDILQARDEINTLLKQKRKELQLTFVEEKHIYFMKDVDGKLKSNFPSVSKLIHKFHKPFDSDATAERMSKGDPLVKEQLLKEWKESGSYSTNMGSRVHYHLETDLITRNGNYKEVRQPIFTCDEKQIKTSDNMIIAGKKFLDIMEERGAVLLDTEMVLGHPELQYTGQPDKVWLIENKDKTDIGLVVTDWKSNQPKNFVKQWYTGKMYPPFQNFNDTALEHYYVQLPFYARLLIKMLEGTKYNDLKLLGCLIILLKDDGTYQEYRVPPEINQTVLNLNLKPYINR